MIFSVHVTLIQEHHFYIFASVYQSGYRWQKCKKYGNTISQPLITVDDFLGTQLFYDQQKYSDCVFGNKWCVFINSYFRCIFGNLIFSNRQKYTYENYEHWHKHSFYDKYTPMKFNVAVKFTVFVTKIHLVYDKITPSF